MTAESATVGMERNCGPATPDLLERYGRHLTGQRALSDNTRRIYLDDLHTFLAYCRRKGLSLTEMDRQTLRGYVAYLATEGRTDGERPRGYARVSIVRKLTALRTFYNFLVQEGWFKSTPVPSARSFPVKVEKPLPSFLGKKGYTGLPTTLGYTVAGRSRRRHADGSAGPGDTGSAVRLRRAAG